MAQDATGTPTSAGIPTFNVLVDAPTGNGFNAAMASINSLLTGTQALGTLGWGPTLGGATIDANLYRAGASSLKTDGNFHSGAAIFANDGASDQVSLGNTGGLAAVLFGSSSDTNLYRSAAAALKTDGNFSIGGFDAFRQSLITAAGITIASNSDKLAFGTNGDTTLVRSGAAGALQLSGTSAPQFLFYKSGEANGQIGLQTDKAGAGLPGLFFGPGGANSPDVSLDRYANGGVRLHGSASMLQIGTPSVSGLTGSSGQVGLELAFCTTGFSTPTGSGVLFVNSSGQLVYHGPSGTVTTIALA